jgi:hypothetical protein
MVAACAVSLKPIANRAAALINAARMALAAFRLSG